MLKICFKYLYENNLKTNYYKAILLRLNYEYLPTKFHGLNFKLHGST